MTYGSSVPEAMAAMHTKLLARSGLAHVAVRDEFPESPFGIAGDTGVHDAIFPGGPQGPVVTGSALIPVFKAAPQLFDESYTLWYTCQSLKDTSDGTQVAARSRAYELLGEVVGIVATDARLGLADTATRTMFHVGLNGDAYEISDGGGLLASGGHGWRVHVGLNCTARIAPS